MAMGRRDEEPQGDLWIVRARVRPAPAHPFYQQLNRVLAAAAFDHFCEGVCEKFYAGRVGRPSVPPGVYFRMLMIGPVRDRQSSAQVARLIERNVCIRARSVR